MGCWLYIHIDKCLLDVHLDTIQQLTNTIDAGGGEKNMEKENNERKKLLRQNVDISVRIL